MSNMKNETKLIPYNLRLPAKLKTRLEKQARDERRSLNSWIVLRLEGLLERERSIKQAVTV